MLIGIDKLIIKINTFRCKVFLIVSDIKMVVGQAEREVLRLKREKMKENVDETEIDAAINHAKAMERVARRKVKHLLQEELAKASGTIDVAL